MFFHRIKAFQGFKLIRFYSSPKAKKLPSHLAITHFDQFYGPLFKNWASIRLGLLCPHFYCAVANVFSKNLRVDEIFYNMEIFNMKDMYRINLAEIPGSTETNETASVEDFDAALDSSSPEYDVAHESLESSESQEYMPATRTRNSDFNVEEEYSEYFTINLDYKVQLVRYGTIHFPNNWDIYYCHRGKFKKFPAPKTDASGLLNYYLMDGASILPVLALDIKRGESVGDLCASPGGKSLAILFGMQFGKLVCNDISLARLNKLKTVLNLYLPVTEEWSKKILLSHLDVVDWNNFDLFDKILLDVPCTNDRLSVTKDNNNIFQQKMFDERMQIPKLQTAML